MNQDAYSLQAFGRMMGDKVRMAAYEAAISRAVRHGDVVLDLGCGPGIMAMLACRAGARRVYAIDTNPVIDFGRRLAETNGFADKIEFQQGDCRAIQLPERADVIVSDIRGWLPLYAEAITTLNDARTRFLAEGGRMIPSRDFLMCGVVTAFEQYQAITEPWRRDGLNLTASLSVVLNSFYRAKENTSQLISVPRRWGALDYTQNVDANAGGCVALPIVRDATGHGLSLWFETTLCEDIGYSTGPGKVETNIYGQVFFPWQEPVRLFTGDEVQVELHADASGGDYIWRWDTNIPTRGKRKNISFRQSTFYGGTFFPASLRKRATDFVPILSESGQAERWLLQAMDGKSHLEEIAAEAVRQFPHVFRCVEDAFNRAAEIAEKYSR
jgi:protein arginine N-methyltransferase 1